MFKKITKVDYSKRDTLKKLGILAVGIFVPSVFFSCRKKDDVNTKQKDGLEKKEEVAVKKTLSVGDIVRANARVRASPLEEFGGMDVSGAEVRINLKAINGSFATVEVSSYIEVYKGAGSESSELVVKQGSEIFKGIKCTAIGNDSIEIEFKGEWKVGS